MNKFQLICADPPWSFSDRLSMSNVPRSAQSNYQTMTLPEIATLPIKQLADSNGCLLALWVPSALLQQGLDVMRIWGFEQKQSYIWVKTKQEPLKSLTQNILGQLKSLRNDSITSFKEILNVVSDQLLNFNVNDTLSFYMGRAFRNTHEICLIGINNSGIYKKIANKSQRTVSFASNLKHSSKPEALQDSLELMFPKVNNRLELFARRERIGWLCLGNEIGEKKDIRESLVDLITA